jgi:tetratricopeptide (TPR) repeat protein
MRLSRFVYDPWELPPEQRRTTFVGRESILERLVAAIREQEGRDTVQHYMLTGPRGVGKTTLLLTLRDRIRQSPEISSKWFCVQLREEEYYIHKQRDLWQLVLQALADEEKVPEAQQIAKQAEDIRDDEKSSALLVDGLRSICQRHNKRLALLVDNFGQLFPATAAGESKHRKPDSEYRAFRKRLSTETFLMLIATSVKLFQDIYAYDKGFFHFFSPVELPELTQDEIIEMLRRLGQADNHNQEFLSRLEKSQVNIRTLSMLTGGNPRLITMLYQILAQREMSEPVQALWETVAGLTPMLRQELADMPRQQSKTLDALLRLNGVAAPTEIAKSSRLPLNVVTTQLGRLKEARYVALEGGGKGRRATYRIADQMFSVWYWMRYVPVARRRIELFTDFIRAWFSLEERKRLFQERLERFHAYQSRGMAGMARKNLLDAEYYAASFDDPVERRSEMERIAEAYVNLGDLPAAVGLFSDLAGRQFRSLAKFESLGYSVLAGRLAAKGDLGRAFESYSEALEKDPRNAETRAVFGIYLEQDGKHAEAIEQFDKIPKRSRLNASLRSLMLVSRGAAKLHLGDSPGALADCTAAVGQKGASADAVALALSYRGLVRSRLGDLKGAIEDFNQVADAPDILPELVAPALFIRGVAKRGLGEIQIAIADFTTLIELNDTPANLMVESFIYRGSARSKSGDTNGAIADFTAVTEFKSAPARSVAEALVSRGGIKAELGDHNGAMADYEAAVELNGAPPETVAKALLRCVDIKGNLGDGDGVIAGCTAVVELVGAPSELVAAALVIRGMVHSLLDHRTEALEDFCRSLETAHPHKKHQACAYLYRGKTYEQLGSTEEALVDYGRCAESGILRYVHNGLQSAVRLLLAKKRGDEALVWVRRLHELEPSDVPLETRLEARLDVIRAASKIALLEDVSRLVDALLDSDPEELRERLQFLKPGLELARTKDESVLANLPEDERKMAREIARTLAEAGRPPVDPPTAAAVDITRDTADRPLRTAGHDILPPASSDGSSS